MRGRKPTSPDLKLLRGNPGRRSITVPPTYPSLDASVPPEVTDPIAIEEWQRLAAVLINTGHVTIAERGMFVAYCRAWARWVAIDREAASVSQEYETRTGNIRPRPVHARADKAFEVFRKAAAEMGLTPSTRSRVSGRPGSRGSKWDGAV